ncbi:MAG: alginate lyase family protein, partial [candidate division KSB1 bacterium]|nr:alginate lyase family protein [candidate division KSB1 bacterium]
ENNFSVDATEDSSLFTPQNLAKYDALVFLNTSGDVLDESGQSALKMYIRGGGGFAGIHGATDTEYEWDWYRGLVGTYFDRHPEVQEAVIRVLDKTHPSTAGLPDNWVRIDEWYNFRHPLSENIFILAEIDESTYSGGTHGEHHPFCWCHEYDGGRSWYTAGGHTVESYSDSLFLKHLLGGIKYAAGAEGSYYPRTLLTDVDKLNALKEKADMGDESLLKLLDALYVMADSAMKGGPFSVTYNESIAPNGDGHDYVSMGPYWWPNPETEDGLPYIRKDGQVNPERNQYDKVPLRTLEMCVTVLALAYYYSDNREYADRAAELVRIWFLNESTRMNPNLNYGQFIPGLTQGRSVGIIETRSVMRIAEAIGLIFESGVWSPGDYKGMKTWLSDYLDWLFESDLGVEESNRTNNHGTWYDVQTAYLALYTGRKECAKQILMEFPEKRISVQVMKNGEQPLELERTRAYSYSLLNLDGLFAAAVLGERTGLDLWRYPSPENSLLRSALDYLIPYALGEKKWPYQQLTGMKKTTPRMMKLLKKADEKYENRPYGEIIYKLKNDEFVFRALFPGI